MANPNWTNFDAAVIFLVIFMFLTPLVMTVRASMTVPFRAFTFVPMLFPFLMAVTPFFLFHRFRLAISIMTMPGFDAPFVNLVPF